ncbi:hypothetical protein B0T21DRAFT_414797 [Apiosordaria backusii]|uniref:Uncharacterized protein n=1 Tax=Apiosordaria backusii TaxID=314023 RepID=A0AA40AMW6_9PEZI|nr:hypothetical protein B0T21DRAFT_414797 [Apiosordaria backusii]
MNAAANAPHMAKLRELAASWVPYGEEDSWSSSDASPAWSPYGYVQKRHIRPSEDTDSAVTPGSSESSPEAVPKVYRRNGIEYFAVSCQISKEASLQVEDRAGSLSPEEQTVNSNQTSQASSENQHTVNGQPSHILSPSHQAIHDDHQYEPEYSPQAKLEKLEYEDSDSEALDDSTSSLNTTDSSNATTVTGIPTASAICEGKLGVVRDLENEEWQEEIKEGKAPGLSQCTWHKTSAPKVGVEKSSTSEGGGGVPVLKLTTPEGIEHGLMDLKYYPGQDWAELDDDEE